MTPMNRGLLDGLTEALRPAERWAPCPTCRAMIRPGCRCRRCGGSGQRFGTPLVLPELRRFKPIATSPARDAYFRVLGGTPPTVPTDHPKRSG